MTHDEEMQLFEAAIAAWPEIQERQWIEEMAEAIQAFCHVKRGRQNWGQLLVEFAHVQFCIRQMLVVLSHETSWSFDELERMLTKEQDCCFVRLAERLKTGVPRDERAEDVRELFAESGTKPKR